MTRFLEIAAGVVGGAIPGTGGGPAGMLVPVILGAC